MYSKEQERLLEISLSEATGNDKIEIYRFDKMVFELTQPSFILQGTCKAHFNNCGQDFREVVEKVSVVIYVNDLVTWGEIINQVKKLKSESISFLRQVHKWHPNETILEANDPCSITELNFAKQQLGTKPNETKTLGIL